MHRARRLLPCVAAALALAPGAGAHAQAPAPAPAPVIDGALGPPLAVSATEIAVASAGGATIVGDDTSVRAVPAPPCERLDPAAVDAPLATLSAAGSGALLWTCHAATPAAYPVVTDALTGTPAPIPGADRPGWSPSSALAFDAVGQRWVRVVVGPPPAFSYAYLDWRTGAVRQPPERASQTVDLDERALPVPLCHPLRRPRTPVGAGGPAYQPVATRGSLVALVGFGGAPARLGLWRCGEAVPVLSRACRPSCSAVTLGPRGLSWLENGQVWQLRRTATQPRALGAAPLSAQALAQTRGALWVGADPEADGSWTVTPVATPGAGRR
jgi:hypothetical protein